MATINDANDATKIAQVGHLTTLANQSALHVSARPLPFTNGHYRVGLTSGIIPAALGANSEIWQLRWAHATLLCAILKVRMSAVVTTTMFAAGVPIELDLKKATGWSVAGTGGTSHTPGAENKMRAGMASSGLAAGDMRIATTAALGAGTKTLETNALGNIIAPGPITGSLNGQIIAPGTEIYAPDIANGQHPILLGGAGGGADSEGLILRAVAVPATGTWRFSLIIDYAEVTAF